MDHKKLRCVLLGSSVVSVALFSTPCVCGVSEVSATAKQAGSAVGSAVKKSAKSTSTSVKNQGNKVKRNSTGKRSDEYLDEKYKGIINDKGKCQREYDMIKERSQKSGIKGSTQSHARGDQGKLRYLEAKCKGLKK